MNGASDPAAVLRRARESLGPEVAILSSFGAESAVLLAFAAEADPDFPVLFLNTGQHFPETLEYRAALADSLGLRNVINISPSEKAIHDRDPEGQLWAFDPDACCALRKVEPMNLASAGYRALVTGRKRSQAMTRHRLEIVQTEADDSLRINPLADWTPEELEAEMTRRNLPRHPLTQRGYPSIGCAPCTQPVGEGDDPRAGRWAGFSKTECGIHRAV
ncbi:phosphoadenylyl-sulfate reductase [Acetobacter sp. AN02]|nr:phosphoadenylyl-sulfate reductase [Acetobacter sp. AN02]MDG6094450.1 phosphoadenylyl-sulfate reductase [Acetobacter sp. AN02]